MHWDFSKLSSPLATAVNVENFCPFAYCALLLLNYRSAVPRSVTGPCVFLYYKDTRDSEWANRSERHGAIRADEVPEHAVANVGCIATDSGRPPTGGENHTKSLGEMKCEIAISLNPAVVAAD